MGPISDLWLSCLTMPLRDDPVFPRTQMGRRPRRTFPCLLGCSLVLRPACSRDRQSGPLRRRLRQLRYIHWRSDCYRLERTSCRVGVAPTGDPYLFMAHCVPVSAYCFRLPVFSYVPVSAELRPCFRLDFNIDGCELTRRGAVHGVSLRRRPWAGRPASSTSRAQHCQSCASFTTLNSNTLMPRFSPTGPTVSTVRRLRGRRYW